MAFRAQHLELSAEIATPVSLRIILNIHASLLERVSVHNVDFG